MRVNIGKYKGWFGPYQLCDLLRYLGISEKIRDKLARKIPYKPFQWIDDYLVPKRKIKVHIDPWDTWNMDETLAHIIVPMLKHLKQTKHGAPHVDDKDVPKNLRSTNAKLKESEWDTDEFHFQRWDYVIDEMIFAFESIANKNWEDKFYSGESDLQWKIINPEEPDEEKQISEMIRGPNYKFDKKGYQAYNKRIDNGLKLFGKYYRNLWD